MNVVQPLVVRAEDSARDAWDDPAKGRIGWRTLFGGEAAPSDSLTTGIAELEPGGWLGLHRHQPAEIYYVLAGHGVVTLEGVEHRLAAGTAVLIPGDAEHGLRNDGETTLRLLYVLAADSFAKVEYRFSRDAP